MPLDKTFDITGVRARQQLVKSNATVAGWLRSRSSILVTRAFEAGCCGTCDCVVSRGGFLARVINEVTCDLDIAVFAESVTHRLDVDRNKWRSELAPLSA